MTITQNPAQILARRPARKRGVTLIEAVLFISIALGLIVGGIVFFQQASTAQRTNDAVRTISGIASEVRAMYQSATDFNGISQSTLIAAGAVPSNVVNDQALQNEWGGQIGVQAETINTADDGFSVTYTDVPTEACVRLVTFDAVGSGVVGAGISSVTLANSVGTLDTTTSPANELVLGTAYTGTGWAASQGGPVTPAIAATHCTAASTSGSTNFRITFTR